MKQLIVMSICLEVDLPKDSDLNRYSMDIDKEEDIIGVMVERALPHLNMSATWDGRIHCAAASKDEIAVYNIDKVLKV